MLRNDELHQKSKQDSGFIQKYKAHSNLLKILINIEMNEYGKERVAEYGDAMSKTRKLLNETKKVCGYDEISNKIIKKKSSHIVAPFLKILFNACLQRSIFPFPSTKYIASNRHKYPPYSKVAIEQILVRIVRYLSYQRPQ